MKFTTLRLAAGAALLMAATLTQAATPAANKSTATQASTASADAGFNAPQHLNNKQLGILKAMLVERYKSSIGMLQTGMGCVSKALSQDAVLACMNEQASAAVQDQKASAEAMAKMQKDMAAAK